MNEETEYWRGVYSKIYSQVDNYHMSDARLIDSIRYTEHWTPGKLLDISCGAGEYIMEMNTRGFDCQGTELAEPLLNENVAYGEIGSLNFEENEFDYVTCWDVLEHLPPGDEVEALAEMKRFARYGVAMSVNNKDSKSLGVQLHINKKPYDEWQKIVRDAFVGWEVEYYGVRVSPILVCQRLIKEEAESGEMCMAGLDITGYRDYANRLIKAQSKLGEANRITALCDEIDRLRGEDEAPEPPPEPDNELISEK